jgi:hypothetical protein
VLIEFHFRLFGFEKVVWCYFCLVMRGGKVVGWVNDIEDARKVNKRRVMGSDKKK